MLVLYMAGELLKPGRIEKVVGFPQYRAAIEAGLGGFDGATITRRSAKGP